MHKLTALFKPSSIAVVGASNNPGKVGSIVIRNLLDCHYPGKIYPINPKEAKIGWLQCYPDVTQLPQTPDLAVLAVPAQLSLKILTQLGQAQVKHVVMFTAGFKEAGQAGQQREAQLVQIAKQYSLTILGPNCLGFANNAVPAHVTFGQVITTQGNLRFISQSGAIASSVFDWADHTTLGFQEFITLGNKSVLAEHDVLDYFYATQGWEGDATGLSNVQPVGMYLESISNGPAFLQTARKLAQSHPIFLLKPGKSASAAQAMQSHTGSIAGKDAVLDAVVSQAGITRCDGIEEFFDLAKGFAWEEAPTKNSVAIISNAGGPAVISADAVEEHGLQLAKLSKQATTQLQQKLPRAASVMNPIDVLGDALAQRYLDALQIVLQQPEIHAVIIILTPQVMTQIEATAKGIGELSGQYQKPIFASFMGGNNVARGEAILNRYKIPAYKTPERAIKTVAAMYHWKQWQQQNHTTLPISTKDPYAQARKQATKLIDNAKHSNQPALTAFETNTILQAYGIATPPTQAVNSVQQAQHFANTHGWPVVLKLVSAQMLHKTEHKGIIKNITGLDQLEMALQLLQHRIADLPEQIQHKVQVQIQRQVNDGVEVIAGVTQDATFGKILLFGAGGTLTELIVDRNLAQIPLDIHHATKLISQSKIYPVLQGYRNSQGYALSSLAQLLVALSHLANDLTDVADIEINPVILTQSQAWAVDGKAVLS